MKTPHVTEIKNLSGHGIQKREQPKKAPAPVAASARQ